MHRRINTLRIWVALGLLASACNTASQSTTTDDTVAATTSTTADDTTSSATTTTTDAATDTATTEATGGGAGECDPQLQDCLEGEKCTAYAKTEGKSWDANKCVPIHGEALAGDLCDVQDGKYTGDDNCAEGLLCMLTDPDGKGGVCIEFCSLESTCPMTAATCEDYNDGVLPICLPACDPLIQDCPEGQACFQGASSFVCFKEVAMPGQGGQGAPCMSVNICQKGYTCADAATQPDCAGMGCCSAFCAVSEGDAACGEDLQCLPFFPADMTPAGFDDVGICSIPQ